MPRATVPPFLREIGGEPVRYAWGYGGQMLYVVPSLQVTVAMTSDDSAGSARSGHRDALHALLADIIAWVRARPEGGESTVAAPAESDDAWPQPAVHLPTCCQRCRQHGR